MAKLFDIAISLDKHVNIDIAVDTGMSRIGYIPSDEAVNEIVEIDALPNVKTESIFTHFARLIMLTKVFAENQFKEYNDFVAKGRIKGVKIPVHQCVNSAAMMEMPETSAYNFKEQESQCMVYPSEEMDGDNMKLIPAMSIYIHM